MITAPQVWWIIASERCRCRYCDTYSALIITTTTTQAL